MKKTRDVTQNRLVIDRQTIDSFKEQLKGMPRKEVFSVETMVDELYDQLDELVTKGYTYAELTEFFTSRKITVKESSLKLYMRRAKAKRTQKKDDKK